jgi:hypothetical protein
MGKAVGTQQHQREDEEEYKQEHPYVHEEFSWLENEQ